MHSFGPNQPFLHASASFPCYQCFILEFQSVSKGACLLKSARVPGARTRAGGSRCDDLCMCRTDVAPGPSLRGARAHSAVSLTFLPGAFFKRGVSFALKGDAVSQTLEVATASWGRGRRDPSGKTEGAFSMQRRCGASPCGADKPSRVCVQRTGTPGPEQLGGAHGGPGRTAGSVPWGRLGWRWRWRENNHRLAQGCEMRPAVS